MAQSAHMSGNRPQVGTHAVQNPESPPTRRISLLAGLLTLAMLGGCTTAKETAALNEPGGMGDAETSDAAVKKPLRPGEAYRDPLVTTGGHRSGSAQTHPSASANRMVHQPVPAGTASPGRSAAALITGQEPGVIEGIDQVSAEPSGSTRSNSLFARQADASMATTPSTNSIVPADSPARPIQATMTSVYTPHRPLSQADGRTPVQQSEVAGQGTLSGNAFPPTPAPAVAQRRPVTKAEILAGLAPDPKKRETGIRLSAQGQVPMQAMPQATAMGAGMSAGMSAGLPANSSMNPTLAARLQTSLPTAAPATAGSAGASQMEAIEGAPQAKGMTTDSFIKKFLAKLRK